jgi:tight adherence protein C
MSENALFALVAAGAAGILALVAALLVSREASHRDLVQRAQHLTRTDIPLRSEPVTSLGSGLVRAAAWLGGMLRATLLFSPRDVEVMRVTARAGGMDPGHTVAAVVGFKALLIVLMPLGSYLLTDHSWFPLVWKVAVVLGGVVLGSLIPNWVIAYLYRTHVGSLRKGLPDALDLMVVCTEAGLGLESAIDRVAQEMRHSAPAVGHEFATLLQDLRMASDRRAALARMGERTGVEGFQRLGGTLSQTLRYGTPVGQALRVLAAEMRQERMLRIEEKAARLPALLSLALAAFILPCLFIVLGGPALMRILDTIAK